MHVNVAESAQIVLRNMGEEDRRKVWAWIDLLRKWDTDPYAQRHSRRLDPRDNAYMLLTNTDLRIFFTLDKDSITVLDVARKGTIISSGSISEAGSP